MEFDERFGSRKEIIEPYQFDSDAVIKALESDVLGLDSDSVETRRRYFGSNSLPPSPTRPAWLRLASQFHNVLIYLLIASGLISLLLQHFVDSAVIMAVVIINGAVGYIQEGKAEAALRSIMLMTKTRCMVLRDGITITIDSEDLVPGDIVMLNAGDKVPADLRLHFVKNLLCDESLLTGESQPVAKHIDVLEQDTELTERANMVFMGTMVAGGTGRGVVCHTGSETQLGGINALVQQTGLIKTPLQKQMERFAHQLTAVIVLLSAAVLLIGVFIRGYEFADMVQAAIGIAVASIPEALPAIVTVTLAFGVMRMAQRHVLVRRLPAVEVLGSVNVICADKTGTLTANVMSARELVTAEHRYQISSAGAGAAGSILRTADSQEVSIRNDPGIVEAARIALLCNDASITGTGIDSKLHGDPTEGALLTFAITSGLAAVEYRAANARFDVIPFDSEYSYMATRHGLAENEQWLAVKGAPDRLFEYCSTQSSGDKTQQFDDRYWQEQLQEIAGRGMRVMALARRTISAGQELNRDAVEKDLTMVALVGISDPPRPEAIAAVARCHGAGIRVKMITGDNPLTAAAIGAELGLDTSTVLTGRELSNLNTQQLSKVVDEVDIFARTSAANKLQLVEALQKQGRVVAMTGDGVNDAPALRKADIGIAMGNKGTDVSREAADIVLTDDNFANIAEAVAEGRTVYDNIHKSIVFILPTSVAEAAVISVAILLGFMLPVTPAQVLWVNMITEITLSLALVFEKSESDIMQRAPRPSGESIINTAMLLRLLLVGVFVGLVVFGLFDYYLAKGESVEYARTIAVTALVFFEIFYLLNCRFLYQTIFHPRLFGGLAPSVYAIVAVLILQLGFCYLPFMQSLFDIAPITAGDWLLIAGATVLIIPLVEAEKLIRSRLARHSSDKAGTVLSPQS